MNNNSINNELQELSPTLRQLKEKQDPLQVPTGYFEDWHYFLKPILESSPTPIRMPARKARAWLKPMIWSSAATGAILVAAFYFIRTNQDPCPKIAFEPLTPETAVAYVEENILDYEQELLDNLQEDNYLDVAPTDEQANPSTDEPSLTEEHLLDALTEEELRAYF
jgi:hypothetical protein